MNFYKKNNRKIYIEIINEKPEEDSPSPNMNFIGYTNRKRIAIFEIGTEFNSFIAFFRIDSLNSFYIIKSKFLQKIEVNSPKEIISNEFILLSFLSTEDKEEYLELYKPRNKKRLVNFRANPRIDFDRTPLKVKSMIEEYEEHERGYLESEEELTVGYSFDSHDFYEEKLNFLKFNGTVKSYCVFSLKESNEWRYPSYLEYWIKCLRYNVIRRRGEVEKWKEERKNTDYYNDEEFNSDNEEELGNHLEEEEEKGVEDMGYNGINFEYVDFDEYFCKITQKVIYVYKKVKGEEKNDEFLYSKDLTTINWEEEYGIERFTIFLYNERRMSNGGFLHPHSVARKFLLGGSEYLGVINSYQNANLKWKYCLLLLKIIPEFEVSGLVLDSKIRDIGYILDYHFSENELIIEYEKSSY